MGVEAHVFTTRVWETLVRNCGSPRLPGSANPMVAALPRAFEIV
jgi:flagellar biosynthesis regulator FlaF